MDWQGIDFEKLANALLVLIVGVLGAFGIGQSRKGKQAGPQTETVELAGAVISDRAADRLIKSMDALAASNTMLTHATNLDTEAKGALTKALTANSASMDRNSDVSKDMRDEIRETGDVIGRLKDEIIRVQSLPGGRR